MPPTTEDHDLELAIRRWLRCYRAYQNEGSERAEEALFEAEAHLLFLFSADTTLPNDLLFPMFKLFVLTLKATDGAADRPNSFTPYTASER